MKKNALVFTFLFILAAVGYGQKMSTPVDLIKTPNQTRWAQVAMSPEGVAHIIWEAEVSGDNDVWYASYDGATVSTPIYLMKAERPAITSSNTGVLAVVGATRSGEVKLKVFDPAQNKWLDNETVNAGSVGGFEPQVAIDPSQNIFVLWYSDASAVVYSRAKINGVWDSARRLDRGSAKHCAIAAGKDGQVWAIWREKIGAGGDYKIVYSKRTKSTSWTNAATVSMRGASASHMHIAVNGQNMPIIANSNVNEEIGFGGEIRVQWLDEQTNPYQTVIDMYLQHYPVIAIDAYDNVHVACQIGGGDYGDGVRYTNNIGNNKVADSTWMPFQSFGGVWDKIPGISADASGNVCLVWTSIVWSGDTGIVHFSSLYPIRPKFLEAPLNPASSIGLTSLRRAPEITYNLTWGANPKTTVDYLQGYKIYVKENNGAYTPILTVSKTTTNAQLKFTDLSKKRFFAVSAISISGKETSLVYF
jgi:hypothetical protein